MAAGKSPPPPLLLSANALLDGAVVYWTGRTWATALAAGAPRIISVQIVRGTEKIRGIDFNDPKGIEYGHEFVKLHLDEMPNIPIMSYNVFSVQSNRFWTGWPNAEKPYANPNAKYIFTQITPVS